MASLDEPNLSAEQLAELSALADGTLDAAQRPEVEARIMASPELRERLERERRVVEILHAARATDRAPLGLRERIEASRPRGMTQTRLRARRGSLSVAALAALALVLALALPSGTPGSPTVSQAAALGPRGPSSAAGVPAIDPGHPNQLNRSVGKLYFPNYTSEKVGYRAIGQRTDRVNGRTIVTVYYAGPRGTVAYSIVGSPPLRPPGGSGRQMDGFILHTLRLDGRIVVTWDEDGHTCLISGAGISARQLSRLATDTWTATSRTVGS